MHLVAVLSALSLGDVPAFPWDTARRRERDATVARSEENPGAIPGARLRARRRSRVVKRYRNRSAMAVEPPASGKAQGTLSKTTGKGKEADQGTDDTIVGSAPVEGH